MTIENDFTRVFGAIKELEVRVEALELGATITVPDFSNIKLDPKLPPWRRIDITEGESVIDDLSTELTALWQFHATVIDAYWQGSDGPDMRLTVARANETMNRELGGPTKAEA
jgi:hypothetical protein